MKRVIAVVAALVVGVPLLSGVASAEVRGVGGGAGMGECSLDGWLCGHIYNDDNNQKLRITNDWGNRSDGDTWRTLNVGKSSDDVGVKDADGFWIPSGCRGTVAFVQDVDPGWHKVRDGQHIHLTDIVC